jgi:lactoylglutathione lyase
MADAPVSPRNTLAFMKLITNDVEQAEAFYTGALGMARTTQMERPGFREIMVASPGGGFTLVLFQWTDGRALEHGSRHGPLGFITQDFDASLNQAVAHGATLERGPFAFPGAKVAFLKSPEGHEIELMWRGQVEQPA